MYNQTNFALVRIIGNDLEPRSKKGTAYEHLLSIVENEYPFENCAKKFLLNRIIDEQQLTKMRDLLDRTPFEYIVLDVDWTEYGKSLSEPDKSIRHLTRINSTRNLCLDLFKDDFEVVLPLDGDCFFRLDGWMRLMSSIEEGHGYAAIQMGRCSDSYPDLNSTQVQSWFEKYRYGGKLVQAATEPQIAFISKEYDLAYDESLDYSELSRIDLLWSIGMRGVWDDMYQIKYLKTLLKRKSKYFGKACQGGWCYRLPSGVPEADLDNKLRAELKSQAIRGLIDNADRIYSNK